MNQKKFSNIILIIVVVILASMLVYVTLIKKSVSTESQSNNSQNIPTQKNKIYIPEEYVEKTEDSANQATFVFAIPVKKQDIVGTNIRHCIVSASAGAQADGRQPECKETTLANSFSLQYNENTRTLIISDPTPGEWGVDSGPFRVGCAACFSAIEFNGIYTSDEQLLPKKMITVY